MEGVSYTIKQIADQFQVSKTAVKAWMDKLPDDCKSKDSQGRWHINAKGISIINQEHQKLTQQEPEQIQTTEPENIELVESLRETIRILEAELKKQEAHEQAIIKLYESNVKLLEDKAKTIPTEENTADPQQTAQKLTISKRFKVLFSGQM